MALISVAGQYYNNCYPNNDSHILYHLTSPLLKYGEETEESATRNFSTYLYQLHSVRNITQNFYFP